ncbi:MAG: hypothetical protein K8W52_18135 [Deltaproteobacteria bacterium]|nr:hypothetical protein [Deltaproteobacteria bacterium]
MAKGEPIRKGPGFYDITAGMLVIGRRVETSLPPAQILKVVDTANQLGPHDDFRWVAAADLTGWKAGKTPISFTWAFGIKIETGMADNGPSAPFALADIEKKTAVAKKALTTTFWKQLAATLPEAAGARLLAAPVAPTLAAFGPLASVYLAYGTETAKGKGLVRGQDMRQESHQTGIKGVTVATAEDWGVVAVDLSKPAHQTHRKGIKDGAYYLVARYD